MSERRTDKKGRILKQGESQRKDGRYQYRYTDIRGARKYLYANSLQDLRAKEEDIRRQVFDAKLDYCAGEITVLELVRKYLAQKQGMRYNTRVGYDYVMGILEAEDFAFMKIRIIKPSDVKEWFIDLNRRGKRYSTIQAIRGVLKPAFDMAVDEDALNKNPFAFPLAKVVPDNTVERRPLTDAQEKAFLEYLKETSCRLRYYDPVLILLGTGMRISELCGLTISDLDFSKRRIHVERQLARTKHGEYYLQKPKTASGERYIPMSDTVYNAFKRALQNRATPKIEVSVGGKSGFIFLDQSMKPMVAGHFEHALKRIVDKYNAEHPDQLIVTPHILRHTFCTKLARAGMPIKELQYLMGHADVETTLRIYTHMDYDAAADSFKKCSSVFRVG